jgi:hypothetical protein
MSAIAKGLLSVLAFGFVPSLLGQVSIYVFPHKQQIAVNGIQTFTAVVTGAVDKGVSWTTTCGNIIQGLNSTIGLKSNVQQSCTVTATSKADKTKAANGTATYVGTPHFLEGVHPRLLLTPQMVENMRTHGWATSSNPYWNNGLERSASNAVAEVDSKWCFSFGGHCPKGARRGEPIRFYEPSLFDPPAVSSLSRDSSGLVTVTMASEFHIWTGDTVSILPSAEDQGRFKKGSVTVTSVPDLTHFTYKESGTAGTSTGKAAVFVGCGKANPEMWCDTGGYKTPSLDATEVYTELFAFMALIDPNPSSQERYRIRAHDMMMWMIDLAGDVSPQTCIPNGRPGRFHRCSFSVSDRAHQAGMEAFPLTVDWIYSSFTADEKKRITSVFKYWAYEAITSGPTGLGYPQPFGVMNSAALLSKPKQLRWQMNNYSDSQYRTVAMLGSVMDAADDPSDNGNAADRGVVTALPKDLKVHALKGYLSLATGAWTYIHWAVAEDPGIVASVLGVSPDGMGEGQGGLTPEGSEYGGNYGYVAMGLLALHTAGADDPSQMPQMSLLTSSHWDLWIDGLLNVISPVPRTEGGRSYYETSQFGDDGNGNIITPELIKLLMPLGLYDSYTRQNPARLNAIRWLAKRAISEGCGIMSEGSACGNSNFILQRRLVATPSSNNFNMAIYLFLLLDPTATANSPTNPSGDVDPRPQYPTEFYAAGHHEMAARTRWSADASWLVTHCAWLGIDHEHGACGQTEFYRKGRWLSKAHSTYNSVVGAMVMFSNSGITIGNPNPSQANDPFYGQVAARGAQYEERGAEEFTPSPLLSSGSNFVYEYFDQTYPHNNHREYHSPTSDVLHASRSLLWLKPDILVYYDQGLSRSQGMFKRDSFNFTAEPAIAGNVATVVDAGSKQNVYLTTVLPTADHFSSMACAYGSNVGDCTGSDVSKGGDESAFLYQVTDTSVPLAAHFLSVLEGTDKGGARTSVGLVQGGGTALDGVILGNTAVLFRRTTTSSETEFVSSNYSVPMTVAQHYVAGLAPYTTFGVEARVSGGKVDVSVTKRCGAVCLKTDVGGLLAFTVQGGTVTAGAVAFSGGGR